MSGLIERITLELAWNMALKNLASNLAIGAALCRAFQLGCNYEYALQCAEGRYKRRAARVTEWKPGCGKEAP